MKKYFYIILILCAVIEIKAQKYIKVTDKETGSSLPDVVVTNKNGRSLITDRVGKFNLNYFSSTDSLYFSHLAYQSMQYYFRELLTADKLEMLPRVFTENEVEIKGEKSYRERIEKTKTISLSGDVQKTFSNIAELLKVQTNLQIKDYGTGSSQYVSSRGMSSENTVVLFNNVKVTDIRSGLFDFSKISSYSIDKIEIIKNADYESANASAGGIIKLYSGNLENRDELKMFARFNNYGGKNFAASYKKSGEVLSFAMQAERGYGKNNYDFKFQGKEYKRENAHFSKSFISGDAAFKTDGIVLKLYTNYSHFKNGIPGFVVTNNVSSSRAENETNSFLGILNLSADLGNEFSFHSTISYNNQMSVFSDPDNAIFANKIRQESRMNDVSVMARFRKQILNWEFNAGYEFKYADINGMNYIFQLDKPDLNKINAHRFFVSVINSYKNPVEGIKQLSLSAHIAGDIQNEDIGYNNSVKSFSQNYGVAIEPEFIKNLSIKVHYFSNRRNPTLNERYFSGLISMSDLKPEKYSGFDVSADYSFNLTGEEKISLTAFSIDGEDKIIWLPSRMALYRPVNYGKVKTTGIEAEYSNLLFNKKLLLETGYTFTDARNKNYFGEGDNSFNKLLVYSPQHRFNFNTSLLLENLTVAAFIHFESERYFATDNLKSSRLDYFFITDLSLSYNIKFLSVKHGITFTVYNLFNEEYMVVQSYPMPLRNYSINYKMEIL